MPELPEVETIIRDLKVLEGQKVTKNTLIEGKVFQTEFGDLTNEVVEKVERVSKHIIVKFQHSALLIHLAFGQLMLVDKSRELEKHCKFVIEFPDGKQLRFVDQRKYGKIWHITYDECLARTKHIGPEVWTLSLKEYVERMSKRNHQNKTIKKLLLDQKFIAGVGNIYASEIMFFAKTLPSTLVKDLTAKQQDDFYLYTGKVLLEAIENKGTTFNNYRTGTGDYGTNQDSLMVYGQTTCRVCDGSISTNKSEKPKDRTSYFCTTCQK